VAVAEVALVAPEASGCDAAREEHRDFALDPALVAVVGATVGVEPLQVSDGLTQAVVVLAGDDGNLPELLFQGHGHNGVAGLMVGGLLQALASSPPGGGCCHHRS
jgi:hypothetical protein